VSLLKDGWDLVWGPVSFRAPFSLFDDALIYVVRSRDQKRPRYVVAIRGTNPISAFDWLFGDFWVTEGLEWPYGNPAVDRGKISLSTALGVAVLRTMRSSPLRTDVAARLWRLLDTGVNEVVRVAARTIGYGGERALGPALEEVRENLAGLVGAFGYAQHVVHEVSSSERVLRAYENWRSRRRRDAVRRVATAVQALAKEHSLVVLRVLEAIASIRASLLPGTGVGLVEFLRGAVKEADGKPLEVVVTGHSKGGCLASTTALWLADTQGTNHVRAEDVWDPESRASVRAVSFAGPTAGNAAFIEHSDRVLADRCDRVVNTLDIVPHAWTTADLKKISDLFGDGLDREPIKLLLKQVVADVEQLGYGHVGRAYPLEGTLDPDRPLFFDQFAHQHMAAYIEAMLPGEFDELTFFSPFE
jgi:hypothetical protein